MEVGHGGNINRYLETSSPYSKYRATPANKSSSPVDTSYERSAHCASVEWRSIPIESVLAWLGPLLGSRLCLSNGDLRGAFLTVCIGEIRRQLLS